MTILDIDIERFLTEWTILRKSLDFNIGAQNITTSGKFQSTGGGTGADGSTRNSSTFSTNNS